MFLDTKNKFSKQECFQGQDNLVILADSIFQINKWHLMFMVQKAIFSIQNIRPSVCLSVCPSVCMFFRPFVHPYACTLFTGSHYDTCRKITRLSQLIVRSVHLFTYLQSRRLFFNKQYFQFACPSIQSILFTLLYSSLHQYRITLNKSKL